MTTGMKKNQGRDDGNRCERTFATPQLLAFYFGTLGEQELLRLERELLLDSELLVDYLDLKRKLEAAEEIPRQPSAAVWRRLSARLSPRKRFLLSVSAGVAVAASLVFLAFLLFKSHTLETSPLHDGPATSGGAILFDSSAELPASSSVL